MRLLSLSLSIRLEVTKMASLSGLFEQVSPFGFVWQLLRPLQAPAAEEKEQEWKLLHRDQVPPMYREPFIMDGYRKTDTTFTYALKAVFRWHNDVVNFWTHFVPFCIFVSWFALEWKWRTDFTDPYFYPLVCFWIGACSYTLFSSMAHLFGCVSYKVRSICFFFDYMGIALYTLGGGLMVYFYHLPLGSVFFNYKHPLLIYKIVLAIGATLLTGLSRFYWQKYRFVIRVLAFVLPYISTSYPIGIRFFTVCLPTGEDCVMDTLFLHIFNEILTCFIVFFFVTKIPERFAPGKFDYVFQSHQLFHTTAAGQTLLVFYMMPIDTLARREGLSRYDVITPDFLTTFGVFGVAVVGCFSVVVVLGTLVMKGVLKSKSVDAKKSE